MLVGWGDGRRGQGRARCGEGGLGVALTCGRDGHTPGLFMQQMRGSGTVGHSLEARAR